MIIDNEEEYEIWSPYWFRREPNDLSRLEKEGASSVKLVVEFDELNEEIPIYFLVKDNKGQVVHLPCCSIPSFEAEQYDDEDVKISWGIYMFLRVRLCGENSFEGVDTDREYEEFERKVMELLGEHPDLFRINPPETEEW